jgi:hypothetical protein
MHSVERGGPSSEDLTYRSRATLDPKGRHCGVPSVSAPHVLFVDLWTRSILGIPISGREKSAARTHRSRERRDGNIGGESSGDGSRPTVSVCKSA